VSGSVVDQKRPELPPLRRLRLQTKNLPLRLLAHAHEERVCTCACPPQESRRDAAAEALSTSPPVWPSSSPWARGAPLALTPSCSTIGRTRQRRPSPTHPARIANKRAGRRDQRSFVGSLLPRRKEGWTRRRWRVGETVGRQEGCRLSIEFRPLHSPPVRTFSLLGEKGEAGAISLSLSPVCMKTITSR